ncbi:MAG: BNR-4 repeat-containing protein [Solirubrobacteraceae bacterium]
MRSRGSWVLAALVLLSAAWVLGHPDARAARPPHRARRVRPADGARSRARPPGSARSARHAVAISFGIWGPGSWCWFGDPRAVHVAGQYDETFVGWIDQRGLVRIGAYDPAFGVVRQRVIASLFHDDHSAPAIFVEPDHRLSVFWSGHNGAEMDYRSTLRPEDISAWGPVEHVPSQLRGHLGFTYPNPVMLSSESDRLYLFWRGADWSADFATRSLDGHWSPSHRMIVVNGQRPYMKVDSNGVDTIALAFTDGHPRNVMTSVFYATYRAGWLWSAAGRRIARMGGPGISPWRADVVYDARKTHVPSWIWDVALDRVQHPVIVYATFRSLSDHQYWYARFDGHRWVSHFLTYAGGSISPGTIEWEYSGGIALDHSDPSVLYLSRAAPGGFEIQRWTTPDGGYHWRHVTVVPAGGTDNVRPIVPRGSDHGPMSLLWLRGNYGSYTNYGTSVVFQR